MAFSYGPCKCHVHVLLFSYNTAYTIINCLDQEPGFLPFSESVEFEHFSKQTKNNLVFDLILETVRDG